MGLYVAEVPWAYPGSRFTKDFDLTVAWFASYLPRSTTSYFMRVDWETVGRCVNRALHDLEPEHSRRLDSLVNIGIDETSYKKGHKYITVIVNHDTNTVVWASEGHGKSVLEKFYKQLTPGQLSSIKVETLFLLILSILALESAHSIRFLYRHFLSGITKKSLNAFYYVCSYAKVDYSIIGNKCLKTGGFQA